MHGTTLGVSSGGERLAIGTMYPGGIPGPGLIFEACVLVGVRRCRGVRCSTCATTCTPSPVPVLVGLLVPELRTARENARLEIGSQRGRNSHQIGVLGIYDLQGLSYGRTELLVADMRLLAPDPSGSPPAGRCQSTAIYAQPRHESRG